MGSKLGRWFFGALALGAAMAAPRVADAALVGFCDFSNAGQLQGLTFNGSARAPAGVLFLTPNLIGDNGSAYLSTPVNFSSTTSFQTHFTFRMYPNGADPAGGSGIAFVLQNKAPTALSGSGSSLGLNGVTPSVAVEFDTAKDNNADPNANHVGIVVDGKTNQHVATATPPFNMKNGTKTDVWIDYDAPSKTLKVFMTQNQPKPAAPLLTRVIDLYASVDALGAGNKVWVGFSGSTGQQSGQNNQDVTYWVFANDGTPLTDCKTCANNNDCVVVPTTPVCNDDTGFCVECRPGQSQLCTGPTPVCNPDTSTCVECNTDDQCGGTKPVCNNHICVPCENDLGGAPPACSKPARPICQKAADPLPGACTECSASNQTECTGNTPVCITGVGTCGCTKDSDCGPANGGQICTGTPGVCVPGCRPNGAVTCPNGENCKNDNDGTGTCVSGCVDDTTCPNGTHCFDPGAGTGVCVPCLTNTDCAGNQVCTPQHTCGECTPTDTQNCDPNGNGGACRPNGQCGCNTDADCGGLDSGRVCDDTNKVCRTGCRGTGGNKCPTGLRCTSTTNAIGQCVTDPGQDGGITDGGIDAGDAGKDGGGTTTDAGPRTDGGGGGADSGRDGGEADDISIEGGGCSCNIPAGGGALPMGAVGAAALGIVTVLRRRRSRR